MSINGIKRLLNQTKVILLAAAFVLSSEYVYAQQNPRYDIAGTVLDDATGETIPGAHVFLTGTTIGVSTDEEGNFFLKDIPEGTYQLIGSFLGYEEFITQIETRKNPQVLEIRLQEAVYNMEITVKSDIKERKRRMEVFTKNFLGSSRNAEDTEILNPEVIDFGYDNDRQILTAEARDRIRIRNEALGYEIDFLLQSFQFNERDLNYSYYGYSLFTPLESRRRRTRNRWYENRNRAYYGSFQHFIQSLIAGNYWEEGFEIKAEMRKEEEQSRSGGARVTLNGVEDTTYVPQESITKTVRYISRDTVDVSSIFYRKNQDTYVLKFINLLNINYTNEQETYHYRKFRQGVLAEKNPQFSKPQNSLFTLTSDSLLIDKSGYIHNPEGFLIGGYWGFERVAELLPINFTPSE